VDAVTLTHTVEEIVAFKCPVWIIPGNHDAVSVKGGRFTVEAFGAMGRDHIHFLNSGEPLPFGELLKFWPIAYMPVNATRDALGRIKLQTRTDETNILLFHNSVKGCRHIGWKCDDGLLPAEVCAGFDWVFGGHFHDTQMFGAKDRGMYLGAPMQHHFGDVGRQAGYWLLAFDDKKRCEREFIPGGAPEFHMFKSLVEAEGEKIKTGDFIRFELRATKPDWEAMKPKVKAVCNGFEARGIRADYKHDPIYHHEARMGEAKTERAATLTMDEAVANYVELPGVVTGDLDRERLKRLGREALMAARSRYGSS
jgi:DNA repair exonuclease SbcCD nuclease subunit